MSPEKLSGSVITHSLSHASLAFLFPYLNSLVKTPINVILPGTLPRRLHLQVVLLCLLLPEKSATTAYVPSPASSLHPGMRWHTEASGSVYTIGDPAEREYLFPHAPPSHCLLASVPQHFPQQLQVVPAERALALAHKIPICHLLAVSPEVFALL